MGILKEILNRIDGEVLNNITGFLGEPLEDVGATLESAVGSLVTGLVNKGSSEDGSSEILKIINDGGHSGDIFQNLKNLVSNSDKIQLLITIGQNINNHFFGDKTGMVVEKMAQLNEVKKTSAASILSLAAPVVLGFLGKKIKANNLDADGLQHYLGSERDDVLGVVPPAIVSIFNEVAAKPQKTAQKSAKTSKKQKKQKPMKVSGDRTFAIVAWCILASLLLAAAYYTFRKSFNNSAVSLGEVNMVNTSPDKDSSSIDSFEFQSSDDVQEVKPQEEGAINPTETSKEIIADNTDVNEIEENRSREAVNTSIAEPEVESTTSNRTQRSYLNAVSQLRNGNTGWVTLNPNTFRNSSAEVRDSGKINELISYMQNNPTKRLLIGGIGKSRLVEDRAYAIRDQLYQAGIPLSRMELQAVNGGAQDELELRVQ